MVDRLALFRDAMRGIVAASDAPVRSHVEVVCPKLGFSLGCVLDRDCAATSCVKFAKKEPETETGDAAAALLSLATEAWAADEGRRCRAYEKIREGPTCMPELFPASA